MRTEPPLSNSDRWRLVGLGLVGYYLSSYLDSWACNIFPWAWSG